MRALAIAALTVSIACGDDSESPRTPTGPSPGIVGLGQFQLQGDPESPTGATWTYRGSSEGVSVDLQGILLKPRGAGRFPAVIISHGAGGNANGFSRAIAVEMVNWGMVSIATNYTHAGGVPQGAPGSSLEPGASQANVIRGRAVLDILRALTYVDTSRVAAHGHSMGAFVTTALVGAYPTMFRAASHTAGGVRPGNAEVGVPVDGQAAGIRTPYQLHHGDQDFIVPALLDERLAALLRANGVATELHVYSGASHDAVSRSAQVLDRVRAWYAAHGMFE
jgi:dienelactone hydrolase